MPSTTLIGSSTTFTFTPQSQLASRIVRPATLLLILPGIVQAQGFKLSSAEKSTFTSVSLTAAEKIATKGVVTGNDNLSFNGKAVRLVVRTGPENDMMSFRVRGMRNPRITVPTGATLYVLFVNTDEDMFHNFRFTAIRPPFDAKIGNKDSVGSANMPHKSGKNFYGQRLTLKAPTKKGAYTYVCTIGCRNVWDDYRPVNKHGK